MKDEEHEEEEAEEQVADAEEAAATARHVGQPAASRSRAQRVGGARVSASVPILRASTSRQPAEEAEEGEYDDDDWL